MEKEKILFADSNSDNLFGKIEEENVVDFLLKRVKNLADSGRTVCISNGLTDESFCYSDIDPLSRKIAGGLLNLGFSKGDTVIYSSQNAAKLHISFIGIWRSGGICRGFYQEDSGEQLVEKLKESETNWILCDQHLIDSYLEAFEKAGISNSVKILTFDEINETHASKNVYSIDTFFKQDFNFDLDSIKPTRDDYALILPTSGSTGDSKGAVYTHFQLIKNVIAYSKIMYTNDPECPVLLGGKQTHYTGSVCPLSCFSVGIRLVMLSRITTENLLRVFDKYKIRGAFSFPKYLIDLVNSPLSNGHDLSCLQFAVSGGTVIGPGFIKNLQKFSGLKTFTIVYGMTEIGMLASTYDIENDINKNLKFLPINELRAFTCGRLPPCSKLKVEDVETGETLGPGEKGELLFSSPLMCNGYFKKPQETEKTFCGEWIKTGDVGYYDSDGWIYVVDRIKEIFKYFNNHISPTEIENILLQHPSVSEACVFGIQDPEGGDSIPRSIVVLKKEDKEKISADEIIEFANSRLVSYKHLRGGILFLDSIPKGKSGKVSRINLAKEYNN